MIGHWLAGQQKRLFGWAATSSESESLNQSRRSQSCILSGDSLVMPFHHTSPSGVMATLVKMVLALQASMAIGLVS